MSLKTRIGALITRIGAEFKSVRSAISELSTRVTNNEQLDVQQGLNIATHGSRLDAHDSAILICKGYDLYTFINGKPLVNEILMRVFVCRSFVVPENFAGSYASCSFAPSSEFVIEVLKQGVRFGTITFAAGSTTGVFSATSGSTLLSVGNEFAIRCVTGVQDATMSDIVISICANQS